jgi:hypothetical protein
MPKNILVSKIRVQSPNLSKTKIMNHNYLLYIGTREGVDLTPSNSIENEINALSEEDYYIKYIDKRPKSHGLFGNLEKEKFTDIDKLAKEMFKISGEKTIYKGIISLASEDAVSLGYTTKEKWEEYLNFVMPDIADKLQIPLSKMQWVAAFHMEESHPHVHYMLWSSGKDIIKPYIHTSVQNSIREVLSKKMFEEERNQEVMLKTLARDTIVEMSKDITEKAIRYSMQIPDDQIEKLSNMIKNLLYKLPKSGRTAYQLLQPDVKKEVDKVVKYIKTEIPVIKEEYDKYIRAVENINKTYSVVGDKALRNIENAEKDMDKRIANIVIKATMKTIGDPSNIDNANSNFSMNNGTSNNTIEGMERGESSTQTRNVATDVLFAIFNTPIRKSVYQSPLFHSLAKSKKARKEIAKKVKGKALIFPNKPLDPLD